MPPAVSVVLPAYQIGPAMYENVHRVSRAMKVVGETEIIVVDDGSTDETNEAAARAAAELPEVRVVRHPVNRGKGAAIATGAKLAAGDIIVLLDGDMDIPPEQVPDLLGVLDDADLVTGAKLGSMTGRYPAVRQALSRVFAGVTRMLFRLPLTETQTGIKLARRQVLDRVLPAMEIEGYAYDLELLARAHNAGFRVGEVPVRLADSAAGASLRPKMMWNLGLDTLRLFWRLRRRN